MSNSWFQFKQFTISQEKCAMKVTTDACIQGAWTPIPGNARHVLDIGTGTGLLALMIAQRIDELQIDAVEYDGAAAVQAKENFAASPWPERIKVFNCDVKEFVATHQYDLIICNPPFFSNSLLSGKETKDRARHDISLSRTDLARVAEKHLSETGHFSILLPHPEYLLWKTAAAEVGLVETKSLHVKHTPTSAVTRVVGIFEKQRKAEPVLPEILVIKQATEGYTAPFKDLLAPFYLAL